MDGHNREEHKIMKFTDLSHSNSVILDNGTLKSALVALGLMDPPGNDMIIKVLDIHVASAEVLIESLLLHDHIYVPKVHAEDYPKTVAITQSAIGQSILEELPLTTTDIKAINVFAESDFSSWPLANEDILKRLRGFTGVENSVYSVSKWDKWIYQTKYSGYSVPGWSYLKLASDFRINHLDGQENSDAIKALLQKMLLREGKHSFKETEELDAMILWLVYRTILYDCISWLTGVPYTPHPQRASLWQAINLRRSNPILFRNLPEQALSKAREKVAGQINNSMGFHLYDVKIPPFFTYVLSKAASTSELLEITMNLRDDKRVRALRKTLQNITEQLYTEKSIVKIQRLRESFDTLTDRLETEYLVKPPPKISPSIQLGSVFGIQFDTPIPLPISKLATRLGTLGKPHLAVLRDVFSTTVNIWKLSNEYDRLFWGERFLANATVKPVSSTKIFENSDLVVEKSSDRYLDVPDFGVGKLRPKYISYRNEDELSKLADVILFKKQLEQIALEEKRLNELMKSEPQEELQEFVSEIWKQLEQKTREAGLGGYEYDLRQKDMLQVIFGEIITQEKDTKRATFAKEMLFEVWPILYGRSGHTLIEKSELLQELNKAILKSKLEEVSITAQC